MNFKYTSILVLTFFLGLLKTEANNSNRRVPLDVVIDKNETFLQAALPDGNFKITLNGSPQEVFFSEGKGKFQLSNGLNLININQYSGYQLFHITQEGENFTRVKHIPLWTSILPPLTAILLALIFKEVVISLFAGVWIGAFLASGFNFSRSLFTIIDTYIISALKDSGHLSIIVFSLLIGGMVALISKNGGMAGVVERLSKYANSRKSSQFVTWLMGISIFFDDYANTLIVGNTMRPVTDKFKISREKLAYIVDSTAAPVAAIAFITTWIGAELGYIADGINSLSGFPATMTPYLIFISSLKYSFYPILAVLFILILIYTGRDFGPMYKIERATYLGISSASKSKKQAQSEDLSPVENAVFSPSNALIPVLSVIVVTVIGLLVTGFESIANELIMSGVSLDGSWSQIWNQMGVLQTEQGVFVKLGMIIGQADSYVALLWASLSGVILAAILTIGRRTMKLDEVISTIISGFKTMLPALLILTFAWSLALTTEELHTATFITSALQDSLNPYLMPMIVFVLAAAISFSTGSSWSTMAILYPIAIPITWAISQSQGLDIEISIELLLNVIATVLAASVMGDHCSPISDTTILSSLASDCDHLSHVKTQIPYALTVGLPSFISVGLVTYLGGGWMISLTLMMVNIALLWLFVLKFGKRHAT
jgi:Na+/H+ antiporter NhaC